MSSRKSRFPLQILVDFFGSPSNLLTSSDDLFGLFAPLGKFLDIKPLTVEKLSEMYYALSFSPSQASAWIDLKQGKIYLSLFLYRSLPSQSLFLTLKHSFKATHYEIMEIPRGRSFFT